MSEHTTSWDKQVNTWCFAKTGSTHFSDLFLVFIFYYYFDTCSWSINCVKLSWDQSVAQIKYYSHGEKTGWKILCRCIVESDWLLITNTSYVNYFPLLLLHWHLLLIQVNRNFILGKLLFGMNSLNFLMEILLSFLLLMTPVFEYLH